MSHDSHQPKIRRRERLESTDPNSSHLFALIQRLLRQLHCIPTNCRAAHCVIYYIYWAMSILEKNRVETACLNMVFSLWMMWSHATFQHRDISKSAKNCDKKNDFFALNTIVSRFQPDFFGGDSSEMTGWDIWVNGTVSYQLPPCTPVSERE